MSVWILVITMYSGTVNMITTIELTSQHNCIAAGNNYINKHKVLYENKMFDLYCQEK